MALGTLNSAAHISMIAVVLMIHGDIFRVRSHRRVVAVAKHLPLISSSMHSKVRELAGMMTMMPRTLVDSPRISQ